MKSFPIRRVILLSFVVFWNNIIPFSLITVTSMLAVGEFGKLIGDILDELAFASDQDGSFTGTIVKYVTLIELFVAASLLKSALSSGTFAHLCGKKIRYVDLINRLDQTYFWYSILKILTISTLCALAPGLIIFVFAILGMYIAAVSQSGVPMVLFSLGGILTFSYFVVRFYIVIPIAVNEHTGVIASFSRSSHLSAGFRWHILGVMSLVFGPLIAIDLITEYFFNSTDVDANDAVIVYSRLEILLVGLIAAIDGIVSTICYFRIRNSKCTTKLSSSVDD